MLVLDLLSFNLSSAWWLIVVEGIPALLITYIISVVYTLHLQMLPKTLFEPEPSSSSSTLYGTDSVVFVTEASSSVVGSRAELPPSYDSLVQAHKEHMRT